MLPKITLTFICIFFLLTTMLSGQSFLEFHYGASVPSGSFSQNADYNANGHAQTGLGLQGEWYKMLGHTTGLGLHYSFSFNNADFLRTGYRYAETYTNTIAGKYIIHDITALALIKAFGSEMISTSIRISGGTSFIRFPEIKKLYYENDVLIKEEVLVENEDQTKLIYGLGASVRYSVSEKTGINFTVDYQNRFDWDKNHNPELRNFNVEQVFILLGLDFILGKTK